MNTQLPKDKINWHSVIIIGEYTTPSGPIGDDHFIVAILSSGELIEYPAAAADQIIKDLEKTIGVKIELRLSNCTDAASRVIFPPELAERPLFDFSRPINGLSGLLKLIKRFGVGEISAQLTNEVKSFINDRK